MKALIKQQFNCRACLKQNTASCEMNGYFKVDKTVLYTRGIEKILKQLWPYSAATYQLTNSN